MKQVWVTEEAFNIAKKKAFNSNKTIGKVFSEAMECDVNELV